MSINSWSELFIGDWSLGPANDAVVLHGDYGYCHEFEVERNFRDSRLAPTGDTCLDDIELRRNDEAFMDGLGVEKLDLVFLP